MNDDIRPEELIARAEALVPTLAERASKADALRQVPEETIRDFQEAGFFRMLQPKRWGGLEVDPLTFFRVQTTVATACPSSAWVLGVVGVHSWQLALFDDQAQQDVWATDRSTLISSSYAPTGKIETVDGGYRVSGRWSFSSGCDHCQWIFVGGFVPGADGRPPDMRTFLVPRTDYRIDDNWHVIGLRGTGSKDILIKDAFVPEHRTHRMNHGFKCKSPGNELNDAPLYNLPFGQIFVRSVAMSALGIAKGAHATYLAATKGKIAAADQTKVAEDPTAQTISARAATLIDEVELTLERDFGDMFRMVQAGESIPIEQRVRSRYGSSNAVVKCVEAVDLLFSASGGRALFTNNPMHRFFVDAHAARAHYANNPDKPGRNYGRTQLGQATQDFFI